jgi:hypothetical protein
MNAGKPEASSPGREPPRYLHHRSVISFRLLAAAIKMDKNAEARAARHQQRVRGKTMPRCLLFSGFVTNFTADSDYTVHPAGGRCTRDGVEADADESRQLSAI